VQLLRSSVPIPVLSAFLDVASAKADEDTLFQQAKAYEFDLLPRSMGQASTIRAQAQIEHIERTASAHIELNIFSALVEGISRDPELSKRRMRLEHLEAALEKARLIISPESIHLWLDSSTRLQPRTISAEEGP
jgi:membrane protease subunit HflK